MNNIGKIFEFIQRVLGVNITLKGEIVDKKGMPSGLAMSFSFHLVVVDGMEFVMLLPKQELTLTGGTYAKRVAAIEEALKLPAILVLQELSTDARRTLIGNRINFVVSEKQLYIPRLALYLTQRGMDAIKKDSEKFAPATQAVLFYHLIHSSLDGKMLKEIASNVGYGLKAVGVAISEIAKAGLCEIEQPDKRTKVVRFPLTRKEIWNKTQPYLSSPIANVYYIESKEVLPSDSVCYSYDFAMARCAMINQPSQETFAIEKNCPQLKKLLATGSFSKEEGSVRLEAWKYSPRLLAENGVSDPLSLWMCYRTEDDERIDGELGRLIDRKLSNDMNDTAKIQKLVAIQEIIKQQHIYIPKEHTGTIDPDKCKNQYHEGYVKIEPDLYVPFRMNVYFDLNTHTRLVFVMKESYYCGALDDIGYPGCDKAKIYGNLNWDELGQDGVKVYQNAGRCAFEVLEGRPMDTKSTKDQALAVKLLRENVVFINANFFPLIAKPGENGKSSTDSLIYKWAQKNQEIITELIDLYNPQIIIGGSTLTHFCNPDNSMIFSQKVDILNNEKTHKSLGRNGIIYFNEKRICINAYHCSDSRFLKQIHDIAKIIDDWKNQQMRNWE